MFRAQMVETQDNSELQREENAKREKVLSELELKIVRFGNDEIVRDASRSAVVGKIRELL